MGEFTVPLTPFDGKHKICVIGNLNIDLIIRGISSLPNWGQEVSGHNYTLVSSGQAGYLALALGSLDIPPSVIGNVGSDQFGELITNDLSSVGADIHSVESIKDGNTGITIGVVREDGERSFISDFASLHQFDASYIERHWGSIESANIVCLVGLFCLPSFSITSAANVLRNARAQGKITVLDTGWDPDNWQKETLQDLNELLSEVDIFLPNSDEALAITGAATVEEAAGILLEKGPKLVVVKWGSKGSYARFNGEEISVPPIPTKVHDTVGAGDVFNAGFLYGLTQGWELEKCMAFGNATSSLYISKLGNHRYPTLKEVTEHVEKHNQEIK